MASEKLVTDFVYPPIPIRTSDWQAWFEGFEESRPYGSGETEVKAVQCLIEMMGDDMTMDFYEAIAKKYPCDDCEGTGLARGFMDDPCETCASTGVGEEIEI